MSKNQEPSRMTAGFTPAMVEWARKQGEHLADAYMRDDICARGSPDAYFEAAAARHQLLAFLRADAEPAFLERVAALDGGGA
jgi:hypothetical protein